jgi:hypothetical protein
LPLSHPRQGTPNTRLENYIQLHRAAPTTIGKNKKTLHFKVFQQTARSNADGERWSLTGFCDYDPVKKKADIGSNFLKRESALGGRLR